MADRIFNREDLHAKIHDGFVTYNGDLYLCHVDMGRNDDMVRIFPVNNAKEHLDVDYTSPDFEYRPFRLGFMNVSRNNGTTNARYLTRSPRRERKASNSNRNILVNGEYSNLQFFLCQAFVDVYKGIYPSFEDVIKQNKQDGSAAISREYMYNYETCSLWCGEAGEIGVVKKGKVLLHANLGEGIHRKMLMKSGVQFYD